MISVFPIILAQSIVAQTYCSIVTSQCLETMNNLGMFGALQTVAYAKQTRHPGKAVLLLKLTRIADQRRNRILTSLSTATQREQEKQEQTVYFRGGSLP